MEIYLIRHAKAQALGENGITTDEERPLTEEGEAQSRRLAHALLQRRVVLDAVVTTPLLRARRTGEILIEEWESPVPDMHIAEELSPECKPRKLGRFLKDLRCERVAIVGHQPDLSTWAAWLLGSKKLEIDFAKGGAAFIEWESDLKKGTGTLIWLTTPDWYTPLEERVKVDATTNGHHASEVK